MKYLIGGLVGFCLGAPAGYFLSKRYFKKKLQAEVDAQVDQYKENWKKAAATYKKETPSVADNSEKLEETREVEQKQSADTFQPVSKFDLQVPGRVTKTPATGDKTNILPDPDDQDVPPYCITDNEFGHLDNFETRELLLWADGVVTYNDAAPEPLGEEFLKKALGEGWQKFFGWSDQYEDELFIRCNQLKVDFDITKSLNKYRQWRRETTSMFVHDEEDEDE